MHKFVHFLTIHLLAYVLLSFSTLSMAGLNIKSTLAKLPFDYSAELSVKSNDNTGRSQNSEDIEKDTIFAASASANYFKGIGNKAAFILDGRLGINEFSDNSKLSNTEIGFTASYLYQPKISFTAIRYRAFLEINKVDSASDLRDATQTSFGFEVNKRFTSKIQGTTGISTSSHSATGDVFDIDRNRFFINADYTLTNKIALYATYNKINGDIVSTASPSLSVLENNDALAPDDAFGGTSENKIAYRLDADTTIFTLGSNYAFSTKSALDISMELLDSKASGGIYYDRTVINISYLKSF